MTTARSDDAELESIIAQLQRKGDPSDADIERYFQESEREVDAAIANGDLAALRDLGTSLGYAYSDNLLPDDDARVQALFDRIDQAIAVLEAGKSSVANRSLKRPAWAYSPAEYVAMYERIVGSLQSSIAFWNRVVTRLSYSATEARLIVNEMNAFPSADMRGGLFGQPDAVAAVEQIVADQQDGVPVADIETGTAIGAAQDVVARLEQRLSEAEVELEGMRQELAQEQA
jgi:hypothetical protein